MTMLKTAALLAALLPCALSSSAKAADFQASPDKTIIGMTGPVEEGDDKKLMRLLRKVNARKVMVELLILDSTGGHVLTSVSIYRMAYNLGLKTAVPPEGDCAGTCLVIFGAGRTRGV